MQTAGQFETRYLNRMSAMLQNAFDQACAEDDFTTAEALLSVLETVLYRAADRDEHRERSMSVLQSVFSRMWEAKHGLGARARTGRSAQIRGGGVQSYDAHHVVQSEARQAF